MIKSINQNHQSLVNRSIKWLQKYSKFLDCVDKIATQITEMNFGEDTYAESSEVGQENVMMFTEEAQDFYNEKFDEIETLINNTLNEWNI